MSQGLRLVLFGPPGAGKGTQANLLTDRLKVRHISSGDLFRRNLHEQTPLGLRAAEYMNQGQLVPDEVTIDIILNEVLSLDPEEGFILDGFPRNSDQAQALEEALKRRSRGLDKVVHIDVPDAEIYRRLEGRFICWQCQAPDNIGHSPADHRGHDGSETRGSSCHHCGGELYQRDDDKPEAVQKRLEIYHRETKPVLDFYRKRGMLLEVSGEASIECVKQRVLKALNQE